MQGREEDTCKRHTHSLAEHSKERFIFGEEAIIEFQDGEKIGNIPEELSLNIIKIGGDNMTHSTPRTINTNNKGHDKGQQ